MSISRKRSTKQIRCCAKVSLKKCLSETRYWAGLRWVLSSLLFSSFLPSSLGCPSPSPSLSLPLHSSIGLFDPCCDLCNEVHVMLQKCSLNISFWDEMVMFCQRMGSLLPECCWTFMTDSRHKFWLLQLQC